MPAVNKNFKLKWWIFTATQTIIILMLSAQTALGEEENTNNYNHTEYILQNIEVSKLDLALKDKNMQEALNIILNQDKLSKLDDSVIRKYSKELKTLLPSSLYTLMTAGNICIRNVGLNEYLNMGHGVTEFYRFSDDLLNVYTSAKCSHDGFGIWEMRPSSSDNIYYVHSVDMNSYIYGGVTPSVYGWIPNKRSADDLYKWTFEMVDHNVYIKHVKSDQYLYGCSRTEPSIVGKGFGLVYTYVSKDCKDDYCLWHFEDCTNVV